MTEIKQTSAQTEIPVECSPDKVFVPEVLRRPVLEQVHCLPSSGHPGHATIHLLQNDSGGQLCAKIPSHLYINVKPATFKNHHVIYPPACFNPYPFHNIPGHTLLLLFVTDLPVSNGHTTILTIIDRFSKAPD